MIVMIRDRVIVLVVEIVEPRIRLCAHAGKKETTNAAPVVRVNRERMEK